MNIKSMQQSIANTIKLQGERLKGAAPSLIAVVLASGALIPLVQGDSNAVLVLLTELGIATFSEFISEFLEKMREKYGKKRIKGEDLQKDLESELLSVWEGGGKEAEELRSDISILLQATQGVEEALAASSKELKEELTKRFADLGGEFKEFRWILDEIKDALADIQRKQTVQLATQKEQLELQREQLTKTNLILKMQREEGKRIMRVEDKEGVETLQPADIPCPYKGLAAFQPQDSEDFFGREELVAELLARLAGTNFLGLVGPSGSGKSSVLRAGVIPSIWVGEIPGSDAWKTVIMTPGEKPLEDLAIRIALQCGISAGSLMDDLKKDPSNLRLGVKQALAEESEYAKLVMVVDQFEEVFTLCQNLEEREAYITALMSAVNESDSQTIVILAIRADFYGRCATYPELASLLSDNQVLVGAMSEEELRRAITLPAQRVGLGLEAGLVELVLREVEDEPGALPMLSHALMETWQRRSGNHLTVQGYLDSGGVSGAIAQTAEHVYMSLSPDQQILAKNIFLHLTELGERFDPSSRRTKIPELTQTKSSQINIQSILDLLVDSRLIVTEEESVEFAHEALIRNWDRLQNWIDEDWEKIALQRKIQSSFQDWHNHNKPNSLLLRGPRLAEAIAWLKEGNSTQDTAMFIHRSQKRERFTRIGIIGTIIFVMCGLITSVFIFVNQAQNYERIANVALSNELVLQAEKAIDNKNFTLAGLLVVEALQMASHDDQSFPTDAYTLLLSLLDKVQTPKISLEGHSSNYSITSASFSPDGSLIVTSSQDSDTIVWTEDGEIVAELDGHTDGVVSASFSSDSNLIVTASLDGTARVWTLTGEMLSVLEANKRYVSSASFSPDGKVILTTGDDNIVRLWSLEGDLLIEKIGHSDIVESASFSPDGNMILTASDDGTARIWTTEGDLVTVVLEERENIYGADLYSASFSPDGRYFVTAGNDRTARVWTIDGEAVVVLEGHTGAVTSASFSPDGNSILTTSWDGTARVWSVEGETLFVLEGHPDKIEYACFSPDGKLILSKHSNHTSIIWNLEGELLVVLEGTTGGGLNSSSFNPDSSMVVLGRGNSAGVWAVENKDKAIITFEGHLDQVNYALFSPDGKNILSASDDFTAGIWTMDGEQLLEIRNRGFAVYNSASYSPDGTMIVISNDLNYAHFLTIDGEPVSDLIGHTFDVFRNDVYSASFSPDGNMIVTASGDGTARIWTLHGETLVVLDGHEGQQVASASFSPDGEKIVTAGADGTIRVWTVEGETIAIFDSHKSVHNWASFSPDGSNIVTASRDGTARVWTLTGKNVSVLEGHTDEVRSASFSPDGSLIVTASDDGTARIWTLSGETVAVLEGHTAEVNSAFFSPDGSTIVTASNDFTFRVWSFYTAEELISVFHQKVDRELYEGECQLYLHRSCETKSLLERLLLP